MSQPTKPFTLAPQKRSRSTATPSGSAVEKLLQQYNSDLRVLLDQAFDREAKLFDLLSERSERAYVGPTKPGLRVVAEIDPNEMSDVANFDEEADAELMEKQSITEKELETEFNDILKEQFPDGVPV